MNDKVSLVIKLVLSAVISVVVTAYTYNKGAADGCRRALFAVIEDQYGQIPPGEIPAVSKKLDALCRAVNAAK